MGLGAPALMLPQMRQVGGRPQLPGFGLLPVGNGLLYEPCLRIVLGHQLGLRLYGLRRPLDQYLCAALVIALPHAPQQRLVRRVLDEDVLECVRGLRVYATLGYLPTRPLPAVRGPPAASPRRAAPRPAPGHRRK